jgi:hypothetical protein
MTAAAVYDLGFGVAILAFADETSRLLGVPLPPDPVYLRLVGVLLLVLGALYVLPARNPTRFAPVIGVSAAGRLLGFAYLLWARSHGQPRAFLLLALGDLMFALLQGALLLWPGTADRS